MQVWVYNLMEMEFFWLISMGRMLTILYVLTQAVK